MAENNHAPQYPERRARVSTGVGGRLAEQLIFGEVSTGSEADLKQATDLARRMVSQWGMSQELGPAAFPRGESQPFLGREITSNPDFSERTAELIDEAIRWLLEDVAAEGKCRLGEHKAQLEALAERLLEVESLDAGGIEQTFRQAA